MNKFLIGLFSVIAFLLISGCSTAATPETTPTEEDEETSEKESKDTLVIGLDDDPPQLDPHRSSAAVDRQTFQSIYNKLLDINENLEFIPELAKEWKISEDGKTYTFVLQEGVVFHDGTPFNAEAVKYNFERMLDPEFGSPRKAEVELIQEVIVVDEYTVDVKLKDPFAPFLATLTDRAGMMVSPTAAEELGDDFANSPVGTGPYKFVDREKQSHINLVRFEDYWRELPAIKNIVIQPYSDSNVRITNLVSGDIDIVNRIAFKDIKSLSENPDITLMEQGPIGFQGMYLNIENEKFKDPKVRQAINIAIDRYAIAKVVFHDGVIPATGPFAPTSWAHSGEDAPKADPDKAKALLAEAGASNLSFTLKINPKPEEQQMAQMMQEMLKAVGITMELELVEFGTLLEQLSTGEFEAARLGWSGRIDPDGNSYGRFNTGGPNNYSKYSNPKFDQLLLDARTTTDQETRAEMYKEAAAMLWEDAPYVFIYHEKDYKAMKKNVKGFNHVPDTMVRTETIYFE
ncbi:ABC transporter substrate-binding protein [Bacillus sp. AK128]